MIALEMTSISAGAGSSVDDGTNAQWALGSAVFRAPTRVLTAVSAGSPRTTEFSISMSPTTSASVALIAATILSC